MKRRMQKTEEAGWEEAERRGLELIGAGEALVAETRRRSKEKGPEIDLTAKLQLRDDCAAVEKSIRKLRAGDYRKKDFEALKRAILCLQTTSDGILNRIWIAGEKKLE